jgi:hypothetical protein
MVFSAASHEVVAVLQELVSHRCCILLYLNCVLLEFRLACLKQLGSQCTDYVLVRASLEHRKHGSVDLFV